MRGPDLRRLYDEHAQPLYAFLLNFTRDESDTHDFLQEIFAKLARDPELLDGIRDERAFLIRLAHNAVIDLIRRRGARERTKDNFAAEKVPVFARADQPDENLFRNELASALAELPEKQRAVVHLKLWEGLTFEQITGALEIPPNTATSRYRYGLDKLRDRLRPLYEEMERFEWHLSHQRMDRFLPSGARKFLLLPGERRASSIEHRNGLGLCLSALGSRLSCGLILPPGPGWRRFGF